MKKYFLLTLILASVFTGCKSSENKTEAESEKAKLETISLSGNAIKETGIETYEAAYSSINGLIHAPARIIANPDNEALVGSLVKGRIKKVMTNPGDFVKQGQSLMELEGMEIGEIKSAYQKSKAQLDFTDATYKRQKSLYEQNIPAQKTVLEAKAEYDKALAEFKAEDEKIHSIGLSDEEALDNKTSHSSGVLTIKAPISGIIAERNVVMGQLVDENSTAFRIINISTVLADAQIYEKDNNLISGKPNILFVPSVTTGETYKGQLNFVSPVIDEKTRTINVRGSLSNNAAKLRPQMFGTLQIETGKKLKALVVPEEALINDNGKYYLFIQVNDTTFEKRDVETGIRENKMVEIRTGIKEKDKVVSKGAFYLKSEMLKGSFGEEE